MYRNDRAQAVRRAAAPRYQIAAQRMRVDVAGLGIDVDQGRPGAGLTDRRGGRDEGHRRRDHFATRSHSDREQRQADRVGAIADGDDVANAEIGRELFFEGLDLRAADIAGVEMNLGQLAFHALADLRGLRNEIDELNLHWSLHGWGLTGSRV